MIEQRKRIAILGAGPSGLFLLKRFVETNRTDFTLDIFDKGTQPGAGMPYSISGANDEHITNVSDNEIPAIVTSIKDWAAVAPDHLLKRFDIDPDLFSEYKVLPRLFFGCYLEAQFNLLLEKAKASGIAVNMHLQSTILDIGDVPERHEVRVKTSQSEMLYDVVVISTGHNWPKMHEGEIPGYYDSPYPPAKLVLSLDHPVAIRGSSLTAIDAIRTLARANGQFTKEEAGTTCFAVNSHSPNFKLVMHSKNGLLPGIRFHLDDSHLSGDTLLTDEQLASHIKENDGFLSLDFIFEHDFKDAFLKKDPDFYQQIEHMNLEEFVSAMMDLRENLDPFQLFKAEYQEAAKSIQRQQSVHWKEMLAVLSFAMNHPAKHFSAEDMTRLKKVLMPLISLVIAFVPQSSCEELLALYDAGHLSLVSVGSDSEVIPQPGGGIIYEYTDEEGNEVSTAYETFVDCIGQPALSYKDVPFKSLLAEHVVSPAQLKFRSPENGKAAMESGNTDIRHDGAGNYYLTVPGIAINDRFQVLDRFGASNQRLYMMAVPYIAGFNPDYSGLDFSEAASAHIVRSIFED